MIGFIPVWWVFIPRDWIFEIDGLVAVHSSIFQWKTFSQSNSPTMDVYNLSVDRKHAVWQYVYFKVVSVIRAEESCREYLLIVRWWTCKDCQPLIVYQCPMLWIDIQMLTNIIKTRTMYIYSAKHRLFEIIGKCVYEVILDVWLFTWDY